LEYQTEISNPKDMEEMILAWDFVQFVFAEKTREKAKVLDYTFCLDQIKDLGVFLEIELLSQEKIDASTVQNKRLYCAI
jgi:adenylate cyclase class IV